MPKFLFIGQDNLLAHRGDLDISFVPTGKAYTPDAPRYPKASLLFQLPRVLYALYSGKYEAAIIPATDKSINYGDSLSQRCIRQLFHATSQSQTLSHFSRNLVSSHTKILILDRYDSPEIQTKQALFTHAESYWKLNLIKDLLPDSSFKVHSLPCWVYQPESFTTRPPLSWADRDIDLFCAFSVNSEAKKTALEWTKRFLTKNIKIFIADSPLSSTDFHEHMARSKIVLSPEGIGYHCFRHYQAMMHGAVPLVSMPNRIVTDLAHGKNSLLYENHEDSFRKTFSGALHDGTKLQALAIKCRECWEQHHSPSAVGDKLVAYMMNHSTQ